MNRDLPGEEEVSVFREEQLRARVQELEKQLEDLRRRQANQNARARRLSSRSVATGVIVLALVLAALFFVGYLPYKRRESQVLLEARERAEAAVIVRVTPARRLPAAAQLQLPGTIQAVTETPVLARADGYVKRRYVDIGDRVSAGQLLAEMEAPELDRQAQQAEASLQQSRDSLEEAQANYEQGRSREELARVTAARWANLLQRGVVSRQENDQHQAEFKAATANVEALAKAVAAARSNVTASSAGLARIEEIRRYLKVRSPFAGVITLRNVDTGTLITAGNTLLFRIAQTNILRTFLNVPQTYAGAVRPGQPAELTMAERPGASYRGKVTRAAEALDPASRTMLVEVQAPNPDGSLLPGMYVQVNLGVLRKDPPVVLDSDAVEVRSEGTLVAVVGQDERIHLRKVQLGRDYGSDIEVLAGLAEGELAVVNPNDEVREGVRVKTVRLDDSRGHGAAAPLPPPRAR